MLESVWPNLVALFAAESYFVLAKFNEITIVSKRRQQREDTENKMVDRGLLRSLVLEAILFVPVSTMLILLIVPPLISKIAALESSVEMRISIYATLGLISYNFPFTVLRRLMTKAALRTLKEFSDITHEQERRDEQQALSPN